MSDSRRLLLTTALGAVAGGFMVAWATRALPRMMTGMMQNMMAGMKESGCSPAEM
jgi:hypothetical protein